MNINGNRINTSRKAKFLGVTFDRQMTLKDHHEEVLRKYKTAVNRFKFITGTPGNPRAPTWLCLKILHANIIPISEYAPVITCMYSVTQSRELDRLTRKAARRAIHGTKYLPNNYIWETTKTAPCYKDKMKERALRYITNDKRPKDFTEWRESAHKASRHGLHRGKRPTPLDVILGE